MGRAVLSINPNTSMNLVLKNIFNKDYIFYPSADVYTGFTLLKEISGIELIVIDFNEQCIDCLDFIHFILTSKIYKKKIIVLVDKDQLSSLGSLRQDESVQIILKPFSPSALISNNYKYLRTRLNELN
ncbi:MAG: hypothetical protein RL642_1687 [Bacteroidota bacterium]|jgi:DNA-binding NtrC family response regulator